MAGNSEFAKKHLKGLARIVIAKATTFVGRHPEGTEAIDKEFGIPNWTTDFNEGISRADVNAVILTSPTQVRAEQALKCLDAGTHVEIEIPLTGSLEDAEAELKKQRATGLVVMGGHTRRFNQIN